MSNELAAVQFCILVLCGFLGGSASEVNLPSEPSNFEDEAEDSLVSLLQKSLEPHKSVSITRKILGRGLPAAALNEVWTKTATQDGLATPSKQFAREPSDNHTVTKTTETHTYTYSKTVVVTVVSDSAPNSSATPAPSPQTDISEGPAGASISSSTAQSTTTTQETQTTTSLPNASLPLQAGGSSVKAGSSASAPSPAGSSASGPDQGGQERAQNGVTGDSTSGWKNGPRNPLEYELDLSASTVPQKNKVILVLIELVGLGLCGVDRCYMGQACAGVVKGFTLGGLFVWAFLDYFFVLVTCLSLSRDINAMGIRASFGKASTTWAFIVVLLGLALKILSIAIRGRSLLAKVSQRFLQEPPPGGGRLPPDPTSPASPAGPRFSGTLDSPVPSVPSRPRSETGPGSPCERRLTESLDGLEDFKKKELDDVLGRSNVFLDKSEQRLRFKSPIDFKPRRHGADSSAEFEDEEAAMSILRDAAEVFEVLDSAVIVVEGHTATPDDKLDDWAHELARNRAECVQRDLIKLGVSAARLRAEGKPGKFGTGDSEVLLQIENI